MTDKDSIYRAGMLLPRERGLCPTCKSAEDTPGLIFVGDIRELCNDAFHTRPSLLQLLRGVAA